MENITNIENSQVDNASELAKLLEGLDFEGAGADAAVEIIEREDAPALDADAEVIEEVAVAVTSLEDQPIEIVASSIPPDEIDAALAEIDALEAKMQVYEEQSASAEPTDMNTELPTPNLTEIVKASEPPAKRERKPRVSTEGMKKSAVIAMHLGSESAGYFALELDDAELDADQLREKEKEVLALVDGLPKKVGEKAANLFHYLKTGTGLSVYTKLALDMLLDHTVVNSEALRAKMMSLGYTVGTASSQTQQMMQLLPALKVSLRVKNVMTANPESMILTKYAATKSAPASAESESESAAE